MFTSIFAFRRGVTLRPRSGPRSFARPYEHLHSERCAVPGDNLADSTKAEDSQRFLAQTVADAHLPSPFPQRGNLLRDLAHSGKDQPPSQFCGCIRGSSGMLARRDDDSMPRASINVDVRVYAALAD